MLGTVGTVLQGGTMHQVLLRPDSIGARQLAVVELAVTAGHSRCRFAGPFADRLRGSCLPAWQPLRGLPRQGP
jgi:hypothetical protein